CSGTRAMLCNHSLRACVAFWVFGGLAAVAWAQAQEKRPAAGVVGGPYKVLAADFTGDKVLDLAVAYHNIGMLTVERGDGRGRFSRVALLEALAPGPSETRGVYNLAHGDIDGDGLPDLAMAVHGTPPDELRKSEPSAEALRGYWRGRIVLARNLGNGR